MTSAITDPKGGFMMTLDQKLRLHPDVVDTKLDDDDIVLLHLKSKTYYSLNLTGGQIWQGLKEELTLTEISQRLQAEFAVEADAANRSVLALVDELSQQQLVEVLD
jgi:Coenzyme PQQ synthesis protein D (PqqD)